MLLYRKENSALDPYYLYNVCWSRLYISRRAAELPPQPSPCTGILTCFLFNHWRTVMKPSPPFDLFGLVLRSTHSMLTTIALKAFLTSVVKVLTWLLATTTKICTNAWSRQDRSLSPSYQHSCFFCMHHSSLHEALLIFSALQPIICLYTCSAINFQGYCICQVSCYTLLSRLQLPWPLSWCLHTTTLFVVSDECTIGHI